ncbi:MAG: hypothetical protein HYS38_00735 [Acidobacteria bacterium]|nr:hypothetical protein [Acidobacteriota bacterium]
MNKRFWIAAGAVFLAYAALGWFFHGFMLRSVYRSDLLQHLWRPREAYVSLMAIVQLSNLLFAFFFVWIFTKGSEARGPLEGIRYGFYIWGLTGLPASLMGYVILPITAGLLFSWLWTSLVVTLLCGLLAALIYKR